MLSWTTESNNNNKNKTDILIFFSFPYQLSSRGVVLEQLNSEVNYLKAHAAEQKFHR